MRFLKLGTRFRRREPRVLLAWEYGSGHTHAANLTATARHLAAAGIRCLAALHDLRAAPALAALGVPSVQNHVWPGGLRFASHNRERPHTAFADTLGNLGLGQADAVAAMLAHYEGLFALFQPDLVLAENAYGAHLAARGRLPVVAFGFGQYLPAIVAGRLAGSDGASWSEEEVLAGLNEGLARGAKPPLARLADLFAVDALLPFGPAAFDLHTPFRTVPALPAYVPGFAPGQRAVSGEEVFVYLQGFAVRQPAVMAALLALRRPIRAHCPDLDPGERDLLRRAGAILEDAPLAAEAIVARSACLLHHGGVGLAALGLSAGLPQVILSKQLDNRTAGAFVADARLGAHRRLSEATTAWTVEETRRACDDAALRTHCLARAPEFDSWFGPDPTLTVAREACRLLGRASQ